MSKDPQEKQGWIQMLKGLSCSDFLMYLSLYSKHIQTLCYHSLELLNLKQLAMIHPYALYENRSTSCNTLVSNPCSIEIDLAYLTVFILIKLPY